MSNPQCSLTMLVSRADRQYFLHTVPHLVRMLNFPFKEKLLLVDTAPLPPRYDAMTSLGTLEELFELCEDLRRQGVIDRILPVRHDDPRQLALYHSHFSPRPRFTRNYRGYPSIACALAIEEAATDNHLWFDGDMLFYQTPESNWVEKAIRLLEESEDLMFVAPHPGPPPKDGVLRTQTQKYERDERGFFRFKHFSSRRYLLNRPRFRKLLPIKPSDASRKLLLQSYVTGNSSLNNWEVMVSQALERSPFYRADTSSPDAWTLHTPDHGDRFIQNLPEIIARVEKGDFPAAQAGAYDLDLDLWTP